MASKKSPKSKIHRRLRRKKNPPRPHAMAVLVDKRGRVLIGTYRTGSIKKGQCGTPGGAIERREKPRKAARREAWEEARLKVKFFGKPLVFKCGHFGVKVHASLARVKSGKPHTTHEMNHFKWQYPEAALGQRKLAQRTRQALALLTPRLEKLRGRRAA